MKAETLRGLGDGRSCSFLKGNWLGGLPGLTPWTDQCPLSTNSSAWRRKVGQPGEPCRSKVVGGQQAPVSPRRPSLPVASTGSEESFGSHRNSSTRQSLYSSRPLGKAQQKVRTQANVSCGHLSTSQETDIL